MISSLTPSNWTSSYMCVSCFIPVEPASWSSWSSWTTCSHTCNGGTRSRSRTCEGGSTCPGDNYQQQICNTRSCPVAASWSSWGSWGGCSVTCGGGRQARIRLCRNGNACAGASTQFRDCNEQACPGMNSHLMLCTCSAISRFYFAASHSVTWYMVQLVFVE